MVKGTWVSLLIAAVSIVFVAPAQAKLVGEFTKFQYCPWTNAEVKKCIYSLSDGGEVVLGSRTVPIEEPVLIQGGIGVPDPRTSASSFYGATNGATISKVRQAVPGGLLGVVPKESASPIVKKLMAVLFENGFLGLGATVELAQPATEIRVSERNLAYKQGAGLALLVKIHLENPLLGPECFIGSEGKPIRWNLTSGKTNPPAPNVSIEGSFGRGIFLEEGLIYAATESKFVDNAWVAPRASGCGGAFSFLVDPLINSQLGPIGAGHNSVSLDSTLELVSTAALKFIDEKNP